MSTDTPRDQADLTMIDPFSDPVSFLAACGLEAELVDVITTLPEAA